MQKAATYFPLLIVLWSCANSELTPLAPEKLDGNYDKVTIDWRGEMALMFQKEVAERIVAGPGTPHYGRLAVLTHAVCNAHIAFTLPPGAFRPPPKVDSAVAVLTPLQPDKRFGDLDTLEKVTTAAFGQRRKMLRASLKSLAKTRNIDAIDWIESCGIDPTARAETLTQDEFRALAARLPGRSLS